MDYLPLFFNVKEKTIVVVGGGEVAERKIETLLQANAKIHVIAKTLNKTLTEWANDKRITCTLTDFDKNQIKKALLVVAATDCDKTNQGVAAAANESGIPVNVVDNKALSNVIFPAIVDRSPIVVAISSGGASPILARSIKAKIESMVPATYGQLAQLAAKYRRQVKQAFSSFQSRKVFWEKALSGRVAELVYNGKGEEAEAVLQHAIQTSHTKQFEQGEVYLVGAGPGDPDLLTFRALRLMQQADVVLYDRLVSREILNLVRKDATKVYVGKKAKEHVISQQEINGLIIKLAKEGKRVLRLKGGDPFTFGRGGEEIENLMQENITFQVVPGVSAANGCSAYAGIPLTHRDYAQSVLFVTGHLKDDTCNLPWQQLAQPNQTTVIYMGLTSVELICDNILKAGGRAELPAAIIEQGTTLNQQVYLGTVKTLPELVNTNEIKSPAIIILGEVVKLHNKLNWFG